MYCLNRDASANCEPAARDCWLRNCKHHLVEEGEDEVLIHLSFEALLHAGGAVVVGETQILVEDWLYLLYLLDLLFVVDRPVEIQGKLPFQPEIRAGAERLRQPQGRRGSDATLAVYELVHPDVGNPDPLRKLDLGHAQRLQELLEQHLPGRRWSSVLRYTHPFTS